MYALTGEQEHMQSTDTDYHHPLSMSKAKRWIPCAGSVAASKDVVDRPGERAKFGTEVHRVVAGALQSKLRNCSTLTKDQEILECANTALDAIRSVLQPEGTLLIEERVYLKSIRTEKFEPLSGTADYATWHSGGKLQLIDLKTGYKNVEAKENLQGIGYLIGLYERLSEFERMCLVEAEIVIVQVNALVGCSIKRWSCSMDDLMGKYRQLYQDGVDQVEQQPYRRTPGAHCSATFCPAAPSCQVFRDWYEAGLELALNEIAPGAPIPMRESITMPELTEKLEYVEALEDHCKQLKQLALARVLEGEIANGWKPIRGKGHKKWLNEAEVMEKARAAGVLDKITSLKTPSAVAKLKTGFDTAGLWTQPETDYRLVRDSDDPGELFD